MKWLILIFSIIKPFLSSGDSSSSMMNPIAELKDMIKDNAVKVMLIFTAASSLATLFAAGIVIIAVDVGAQYDQNAYVYFSSMITMGLILILLPIIIGAIGIRIFQSDDRKEKEREVLTSVGTSHPLQDALALLIHDFVKEREMRRSEPETRPHHAPHEHPQERPFDPNLPRH
jgi:hypothetical protein